MLKNIIHICAVGFMLCLPGCARIVSQTTDHSAAAQSRQSIAEQLTHCLKTHVFDKWFPGCLDDVNGGCWEAFDNQWERTGNGQRNMVMQARLLWVSSLAASFDPDQPAYRQVADHAFAYLNNVMWDKEHGGWYWQVDINGQPTPAYRNRKHAYGTSFGIYGCAAYYQLTGNKSALDLARNAFERMEQHLHDAQHGGYLAYSDAAWNVIPLASGEKSPISRRAGVKDMNTHIHLLESFTALYQQWPDPLLKQRIVELLDAICFKMHVSGSLGQYFLPDWTPLPANDSFGHDVETTYLILESLEVIDMHNDQMIQIAKSLSDHALAVAHDQEHGGLFDHGDYFGYSLSHEPKAWWSQMEFLNTMGLLAARYPDDPHDYRRIFQDQWRYVQTCLIDHQDGGFFVVDHCMSPSANPYKGNQWFGPYHIARALANSVKNLNSK